MEHFPTPADVLDNDNPPQEWFENTLQQITKSLTDNGYKFTLYPREPITYPHWSKPMDAMLVRYYKSVIKVLQERGWFVRINRGSSQRDGDWFYLQIYSTQEVYDYWEGINPTAHQ